MCGQNCLTIKVILMKKPSYWCNKRAGMLTPHDHTSFHNLAVAA